MVVEDNVGAVGPNQFLMINDSSTISQGNLNNTTLKSELSDD